MVFVYLVIFVLSISLILSIFLYTNKIHPFSLYEGIDETKDDTEVTSGPSNQTAADTSTSTSTSGPDDQAAADTSTSTSTPSPDDQATGDTSTSTSTPEPDDSNEDEQQKTPSKKKKKITNTPTYRPTYTPTPTAILTSKMTLKPTPFQRSRYINDTYRTTPLHTTSYNKSQYKSWRNYFTSPYQISNVKDIPIYTQPAVQTLPHNTNTYFRFDPLSLDIGFYTDVDEIHHSTAKDEFSDNAMDDNWGGVAHTNNSIKAGKYNNRVSVQPIYSKSLNYIQNGNNPLPRDYL